MRWLVGDGPTAVLARRALPFVIVVPLLIGWLRLLGQERGLYGTAFGTTLFVLVLVGVLVGLVTWNIRTIETKEEALRRADRRVAETLASITDGLVTFEIESLKLVEGTYRLDLAAHKLDGYPYDYHRLLYSFRMKSRTKDVGIYRPDHRWTFSPNVRFKTGPGASRD